MISNQPSNTSQHTKYRYNCNCKELTDRNTSPTCNTDIKARVTSVSDQMKQIAITSMLKCYLCGRVDKKLCAISKSTTSSCQKEDDNSEHANTVKLCMQTTTPWHISAQIEKAAVKTTKICNLLKEMYNTDFSTR